jgi:hypothetical protein
MLVECFSDGNHRKSKSSPHSVHTTVFNNTRSEVSYKEIVHNFGILEEVRTSQLSMGEISCLRTKCHTGVASSPDMVISSLCVA